MTHFGFDGDQQISLKIAIDRIEMSNAVLEKRINQCNKQLKGKFVNELEGGQYKKRWEGHKQRYEQALEENQQAVIILKQMLGKAPVENF